MRDDDASSVTDAGPDLVAGPIAFGPFRLLLTERRLERDGKTQVASGLQAGDKIVGDGSLFLQFQNSLQR